MKKVDNGANKVQKNVSLDHEVTAIAL